MILWSICVKRSDLTPVWAIRLHSEFLKNSSNGDEIGSFANTNFGSITNGDPIRSSQWKTWSLVHARDHPVSISVWEDRSFTNGHGYIDVDLMNMFCHCYSVVNFTEFQMILCSSESVLITLGKQVWAVHIGVSGYNPIILHCEMICNELETQSVYSVFVIRSTTLHAMSLQLCSDTSNGIALNDPVRWSIDQQLYMLCLCNFAAIHQMEEFWTTWYIPHTYTYTIIYRYSIHQSENIFFDPLSPASRWDPPRPLS